MKKLLVLLLGMFMSSLTMAQDVIPEASQLKAGDIASTQEITALLDDLMGMGSSEADIMKGLQDMGINVGYMVKDIALDEVFKALATAAVYSKPALMIWNIREKQKKSALVKQIIKMRAAWKDGQEKLNKIRYQQFKLKYTYADALNKPGVDLDYSPSLGIIDDNIEKMWDDRTSVLKYFDENYNPGGEELKRKYLGNDWDWTNVVIPLNKANDDSQLKALKKVVTRSGPGVYTTPYERMQLSRQLRGESSRRQAEVRALRIKSEQTFKQLRQREQEAAERKYWNTIKNKQ